jgi:hypothetical protein
MWVAPSTVAIGKGACSVIAVQKFERSGRRSARFSFAPITLPLLCRFRFRSGFFLLAEPRRYSGGQTNIVGLALRTAA